MTRDVHGAVQDADYQDIGVLGSKEDHVVAERTRANTFAEFWPGTVSQGGIGYLPALLANFAHIRVGP